MAAVPQLESDDDRLYSFEGRQFSYFGILNRINCNPVDEDEEIWFDEYNSMLRELFEHTVFPPFPPAGVEEPVVLDCGFGTAAWIDDLLTEHDCDVIGVDIFFRNQDDEDDEDEEEDEADDDAVQEFRKVRWNLNASFRGSGLLRQSFDLINSRFLAEGINRDRWQSYIAELRALLKPGGWLQMVEAYPIFQSDAGRAKPNLDAWWENYKIALESINKEPRIAPLIPGLMIGAGFQNVLQRVFDVPIGGWKPGLATLGDDNVGITSSMLESRSIIPFLKILQMDLRPIIQGARHELSQPDLRLYYKVYVVLGQNPVTAR